MNIGRVHIENLRSIEALDIDLTAPDGMPRRRLLLLGGNGTGKTTTLLAIAHALSQGDGDLGAERLGPGDVRQRAMAQPSPASVSPPAPISALVAIEVQSSQEDRAWWTQYFSRKDTPPERGTLGATIAGRPRDHELQRLLGPQGTEYYQAADQPGQAALLRSVIRGRRHPPGVLLPADRGTLRDSEHVSVAGLSTFEPRAGCLSTKRERFQLVPSLLALAYMAPDLNDRDGTVTRMWKVLAKYFPEMPRPVGVRGLRLLFETSDGTVVDLPRLSDGQRAVLLILGELALRNPAGGIVIIDELEQHLHPRWQRAILDALVALLPDAQFLITTQAPYLAAAAPDDVITMGDWKRDGPQ